MQDPAKPKNSAMVWNPEQEWSANENLMNMQTFPPTTTDTARYINEDSKTSMDDATLNDENYLCKEDRDPNFNMESSNSSESCQSIKEVSFKQDMEAVVSVMSSTSVTNTTVNNASITQTARSNTRQKGKSSKESNR